VAWSEATAGSRSPARPVAVTTRNSSAPRRPGRHPLAQKPGDLDQDVVAGLVAVSGVEEAEGIEVQERHPDRLAGRLIVVPGRVPGGLHLLSEPVDERAVVGGTGQGIFPGRLDEEPRLVREPTLRGAEDEEEQREADQRGDEGDRHHPEAALGQLRQDRRGVAPDGDHREERSAIDDRQVLAQDVLGVERGEGRGGGRIDDRRVGELGLDGRVESRARGRDSAHVRAVVADDHRSVGCQQCGMEDPAPVGEELETVLEGRLAFGAHAARLQVGRTQVQADEAAHRRGVGADGRVQQDRRRVGGHECCLPACCGPDDQQERGQDQDQKGRPCRRPSIHRLSPSNPISTAPSTRAFVAYKSYRGLRMRKGFIAG
jgi:hypothetical protein